MHPSLHVSPSSPFVFSAAAASVSAGWSAAGVAAAAGCPWDGEQGSGEWVGGHGAG